MPLLSDVVTTIVDAMRKYRPVVAGQRVEQILCSGGTEASLGVLFYYYYYLGLDSSVDIDTRLGAGRTRNRGLIPGGGKGFFFCPKCPDRLWAPTPYLLLKAHRGGGRGTY